MAKSWEAHSQNRVAPRPRAPAATVVLLPPSLLFLPPPPIPPQPPPPRSERVAVASSSPRSTDTQGKRLRGQEGTRFSLSMDGVTQQHCSLGWLWHAHALSSGAGVIGAPGYGALHLLLRKERPPAGWRQGGMPGFAPLLPMPHNGGSRLGSGWAAHTWLLCSQKSQKSRGSGGGEPSPSCFLKQNKKSF